MKAKGAGKSGKTKGKSERQGLPICSPFHGFTFTFRLSPSSFHQRALKDQTKEHRLRRCSFLVAGTGFEPMTFGL
jgi:hypothetical protein